MLDCWKRDARSETCLRLRLKPLTLGHVFLLADLESVFVSGIDSGDHLAELSLAVFVCSQSTQDARSGLGRWWAKAFFRMWARACRRLTLTDESQRFVDWFKYQTAGPSVVTSTKAGESRTIASPWWVNLLSTLMGELGIGYDDAMAMPIRTARQLLCALAEARGQMEIQSEEKTNWFDAIEHWEAERQRRGCSAIEFAEQLRAEAVGRNN